MTKLIVLEETSLGEQIKRKSNNPIVDYRFSIFSDGEMFIEILNPVRGDDVVIISSISRPVNDNLIKILITCDALKRASAKSITLIAPYLCYSRQDRKTKPRQPITARLIADLLQAVGINRIITCDLHSSQIEGFYNIPLDNLPILKIFGSIWKRKYNNLNPNEYVVISPDHGGFIRAKKFAEEAGISNLAIIHKQREKANEVSSMQVIGDIKNKNCIIVDDMVDTGGTLIKASALLKSLGAKNIYIYCTHGILSGNAIEDLSKCNDIKKLFISNSIDKVKDIPDKIDYIDISSVIVSLIKTLTEGGSLNEPIQKLLKKGLL